MQIILLWISTLVIYHITYPFWDISLDLYTCAHHGEIQGNDDAKAVPFTSLHWSQTLNSWNGCWICKSLDFAEIFFFGFPWGSYGSRLSCRKGTMREVCGARYVRLGSEVALLIQIGFSRFQPAFVGISCKVMIYKWFFLSDCGLQTSRYGASCNKISCWWMTPRQISMWNVHMWPSSALDLTPVGVCNVETNPLDLCWCAISKNVHVLICSFGPSKLLIWRPKNHWWFDLDAQEGRSSTADPPRSARMSLGVDCLVRCVSCDCQSVRFQIDIWWREKEIEGDSIGYFKWLAIFPSKMIFMMRY